MQKGRGQPSVNNKSSWEQVKANMNEKTKQKTEVPTWLHIPEEITYDNLVIQLHNWLLNTGRDKLYQLAKKRELVSQINFKTDYVFDPVDNKSTQVNKLQDIQSSCITEIESIIKLLNKHKALLEASKGIE